MPCVFKNSRLNKLLKLNASKNKQDWCYLIKSSPDLGRNSLLDDSNWVAKWESKTTPKEKTPKGSKPRLSRPNHSFKRQLSRQYIMVLVGRRKTWFKWLLRTVQKHKKLKPKVIFQISSGYLIRVEELKLTLVSKSVWLRHMIASLTKVFSHITLALELHLCLEKSKILMKNI